MSDLDVNKKEVIRLRHLLLKMAELAEHVEQTGSFESGLNNSITRYNTIVQRLEQLGACANGLFPPLDSDASAGTLGAEATLLAEYLEDFTQEEEKGPKNAPDINTIVSLAPFLGREELGSMVRERFRSRNRGGRERGRNDEENDEDTNNEESSRPSLKTLVHLAPHMSSSDLGDLVRAYVSQGDGVDLKYIVHLAPHMNSEDLGLLVRACVSGEKGFNSKYLMHLAPHMNSKDLSAIMRDCMPEWFGGSESNSKQSQGKASAPDADAGTAPDPPAQSYRSPAAPPSPPSPVSPVSPPSPPSPVSPVEQPHTTHFSYVTHFNEHDEENKREDIGLQTG
jgi:hypothetical protein